VEKEDSSFFMKKDGGNEQAGIFPPRGPVQRQPQADRTQILNSAALKFVPRKSWKKEGYGKYEALFN